LARAAKRPIRFLRDRHATACVASFSIWSTVGSGIVAGTSNPLRDPSLLDVEDRLGRALALLPAANGRFTL
jgi:hypothetical protein